MTSDPTVAPPATPFFGAEHEQLRDTLRRFIAERVLPQADAWEQQGQVPRAVLREMGALGLLGIRYPACHGGSELDTLATVVLAEELGRSTYGGFAVTVLVHTDMASPHLVNAGTPEQIERYLADVIAGRRICAIAMTEADAGSDLAGMRTRARRDGDHWVLDGAKMFITNGVHGDLFFVAAKTGAPGRNRDITMFIVERGTPGFRVARTLDKHGWLSSDTAELVFEGCRIPAANLLGEEGKGFYALMKNLQNERIVLGAQAMGEPAIQLDTSKLFWIGTLAPTSETVAVWRTTGVKTIQDAMRTEVVIGASGKGSITYTFPKLLNELVGTKFKIVSGYRGGNDINVAMERGEVGGRENTWSSWKSTKPHWLKNGDISVIVQGGDTAKDLPGVANVETLAKNDDDRRVMQLIFAGSRLGRPLVTTPGVPADRVKALRDAFDATMKDPEFLAACAQAKVEVDPIPGTALQTMVDKILAVPKPIALRAKAMLE